ncbi:hypothetical protein AB0A74_03005 [Saccharothrix sp. NPDC042600]|uniref:hypothetical protein n=1 Tax=Saccharothrix TaxID=2071 RepID=UPI0033E6E7A0|nr:hypothetical protein GCM10017745_67440 [Saccharothrix mutabilis subsp. capreolus]
MPISLPPDPPAIVEKVQDAMQAEMESKQQRDKRKDGIEQGVNASNQPKTSGK